MSKKQNFDAFVKSLIVARDDPSKPQKKAKKSDNSSLNDSKSEQKKQS